jgi:hypothetical protein
VILFFVRRIHVGHDNALVTSPHVEQKRLSAGMSAGA